MKNRVFLHFVTRLILAVTSLMLAGCGPLAAQATPTQPPTLAAAAAGTPIPARATGLPSATPGPDREGTETLIPEVPFELDATRPADFPPPARTEVSGQVKFQYTRPEGFEVQESASRVLMENPEKNIFISLDIMHHNGNSSAQVFLSGVMQESVYKSVGTPVSYEVSGYPGWSADLTGGIYEDGVGQMVVVDIGSDNLFLAIGVAKGEAWESGGKQIFQRLINSIMFHTP